MAKINVVVIGAGGARTPGTVDLFARILKDQFMGSRVVLMDNDPTHLEMLLKLSNKLATQAGSNVKFEATTDLMEALRDADAVLTTFRPGGLKARHLHESIPLKYGVMGNETIAPGGTYLSWQAIHAMKRITDLMKAVSKPEAMIFNYTNHVPLVSQGTVLSGIPTFSFCEGPQVFPPGYASGWDLGLDHDKLDTMMIGLNHACFTVRQTLDGQEFMPIFKRRVAELERHKREQLRVLRRNIAQLEKYSGVDPIKLRDLRCEVAGIEDFIEHGMTLLRYSAEMNSLAAHYYDNILDQDHRAAQVLQSGMTRAQQLMSEAPGIWEHYYEQANKDGPAVIDPERSRGSVWEMALAIEAISSVFNDEGRILPCNILNENPVRMYRGERTDEPKSKIIADFPSNLVVEVWAQFNRHSVTPVPMWFKVPAPKGLHQDARMCPDLVPYRMPPRTLPMLNQLAEYQLKAGRVGWDYKATRKDAIDCLASHPIFQSWSRRHLAEKIHDDMIKELLALDPNLLPHRLLKD